MSSDYIKIIASNKKARHHYLIESEYEAGIVLAGSEVKSIRGGRVSFQDSYADIKIILIFFFGKKYSPPYYKTKIMRIFRFMSLIKKNLKKDQI